MNGKVVVFFVHFLFVGKETKTHRHTPPLGTYDGRGDTSGNRGANELPGGDRAVLAGAEVANEPSAVRALDGG